MCRHRWVKDTCSACGITYREAARRTIDALSSTVHEDRKTFRKLHKAIPRMSDPYNPEPFNLKQILALIDERLR